MTEAAARRRNTGRDASHDDIMQAISDLQAETRVGFAQLNGRVDGMDKALAELATSLQRNWQQTDEHSLALARAEAYRDATKSLPTAPAEPQPSGGDRAVIYISPNMMRLMTWGTAALLLAMLVIAALAGVSVPRWLA